MTKLRLEVKNIKTFKGMDGVGLNATLYFDGKRVCEVIDEGSGGEPYYRWAGATHAEADATEKKVEAYVSTLTPKFELDGMDAGFVKDHLNQRRMALKCPNCGGGIYECVAGTFKGTLYCVTCNRTASFNGNTLESFINMVVDEHEANKTFRRLCRTKTLVRFKGDGTDQYHVFKVKFSPEAKAALMSKRGGDVVEIINERFA